MGCRRGYLSGVKCRLPYGPADATVSCFSEIQIGFTLPFWYQLTWVVPEKGPLNVCACCNRSVSPAHGTHSSKPAVAGFLVQGQCWDRLYHFTDPAVRMGSASKYILETSRRVRRKCFPYSCYKTTLWLHANINQVAQVDSG